MRTPITRFPHWLPNMRQIAAQIKAHSSHRLPDSQSFCAVSCSYSYTLELHLAPSGPPNFEMAGQCCHRRVDAPTERHSLLGNSIKVPKASPVDAIVNLICIIVFVTASSGPFFVLPLTQLVEDVVCQQYYDELQRSDEPFGEVECKLNPIQSKMALIFATMDMIRAICGFVSVFPWSVAADR